MTHKTNTLMSHSGEHSTYPANKPLPKQVAKSLRSTTIRAIVGKGHNRRSRRYTKQQIRQEIAS